MYITNRAAVGHARSWKHTHAPAFVQNSRIQNVHNAQPWPKPMAMMVDGQLAAAANKNTHHRRSCLAMQTRDGARKWQSRR